MYTKIGNLSLSKTSSTSETIFNRVYKSRATSVTQTAFLHLRSTKNPTPVLTFIKGAKWAQVLTVAN